MILLVWFEIPSSFSSPILISFYMKMFFYTSPTLINESQHGGKVPTFKPQKTIKNMIIYHYNQILIILYKYIHGFCIENWI